MTAVVFQQQRTRTSPFLPNEMVRASMSSTQVMKSPCVKLPSVSVCSPLWYRLPL